MFKIFKPVDDKKTVLKLFKSLNINQCSKSLASFSVLLFERDTMTRKRLTEFSRIDRALIVGNVVR